MSCLHGSATIASFFPRNYGSGLEPNDFEDIIVRKSAKKKDVLNQEKHKNNRSTKHKNNIDKGH